MSFFASLRKEWLEQWRTYRLLVVAAILVAFGMASPLLAKFMPELLKAVPGGEQFAGLIPPPTIADAVGQYIKNTSQFAVILALLVTMGAVAQEKDKGTAAMMLVKPLPRSAFVLAKFCAISVTFLLSVTLAGLAAYFYTLVLFGALDLGRWLALNGLIWLYTLFYVAATLLFSTLVRSQAAAIGLGFGVILLLSIIGAVPALGQYLPAQLVTWGAGLLLGHAATSWSALGVTLGLIAACLLAAWLALERQEL
jgi:ABC-2 type transport system permease protein